MDEKIKENDYFIGEECCATASSERKSHHSEAVKRI